MTDTEQTPYELIYWHPTPGRGEYVRLLLEHGQIPYVDAARVADRERGEGFQVVVGTLKSTEAPVPPYARRSSRWASTWSRRRRTSVTTSDGNMGWLERVSLRTEPRCSCS